MSALSANEYRCAACGGVFNKGWSDEEAIKEHFEGPCRSVALEECDLVCDDCFKAIKASGIMPLCE